MALRCAAGDETGGIFDGVLAVDPNLEKETCFLTGMFSGVDPQNGQDIVGVLKKVGEECGTVDEWLLVHDHVVDCVDKLSTDLSALVRQCQDIAGPFFAVAPGEPSPFIQWFREARVNTSRVQCVFADDPQKRTIIAAMRMQHMENRCLGDQFTDDAFTFIPETRHLDLMRPAVFLRHMTDLATAL